MPRPARQAPRRRGAPRAASRSNAFGARESPRAPRRQSRARASAPRADRARLPRGSRWKVCPTERRPRRLRRGGTRSSDVPKGARSHSCDHDAFLFCARSLLVDLVISSNATRSSGRSPACAICSWPSAQASGHVRSLAGPRVDAASRREEVGRRRARRARRGARREAERGLRRRGGGGGAWPGTVRRCRELCNRVARAAATSARRRERSGAGRAPGPTTPRSPRIEVTEAPRRRVARTRRAPSRPRVTNGRPQRRGTGRKMRIRACQAAPAAGARLRRDRGPTRDDDVVVHG